jgi:hypothetical protein
MRGSVAASTLVVGLTLVCACGPQVTWTRRISSPARAPGCAFDVIQAGSAQGYSVIGVIDIDAFAVRALPKNDIELRRAVADRVCRVGGDAVLPGINGDGRYVLATVLKQAVPPSVAPCCEPKPGPSGAGLVQGSQVPGSQDCQVRDGGSQW